MQYTPEERQVISKTIISQMGGFGKLKTMISASLFLTLESGVRFKFCGSRKFNKVEICLSENDTYTMKIYHVSPSTMKEKNVVEFKNVYCDQLKNIFEQTTGLYLSI